MRDDTGVLYVVLKQEEQVEFQAVGGNVLGGGGGGGHKNPIYRGEIE